MTIFRVISRGEKKKRWYMEEQMDQRPRNYGWGRTELFPAWSRLYGPWDKQREARSAQLWHSELLKQLRKR